MHRNYQNNSIEEENEDVRLPKTKPPVAASTTVFSFINDYSIQGYMQLSQVISPRKSSTSVAPIECGLEVQQTSRHGLNPIS